jgi:uncharacterized membrane protein YcaP (DUF421 family)
MLTRTGGKSLSEGRPGSERRRRGVPQRRAQRAGHDGDLVQQGVTQEDHSVTGAVLAVGTFALLTVALSWTQWRFPRSRDLITGRAVLVVSDGRLDEATMRRQPLSVADLLVSAREQGIRRTSDLEYAVLEADGRISFFAFEQHPQSGAAEKPPES